MMKKIIVLLFLVMAVSLAFSAEIPASEVAWNAGLILKLDKQTFAQNEPITGEITIENRENAPLVGAKVVLQIVQGEYFYPSQYNNAEIILHEQVIDFNWMVQGNKKTMKFTMPAQKSGDYRVDAYAWAVKSKMIGASNILLNPISSVFSIPGEKYKRPTIFREITVFNGTVGPVGFPVKSQTAITGDVVLSGLSNLGFSNLKVGAVICEWATAFCDTQNEVKADFGAPDLGGTAYARLNLTAPKIPSAYEILFKVYSGDEVIGMYKNRAIVSGPTSKARKILIEGLDKRSYSIKTYLVGTPDHFAMESFTDFDLKVNAYKDGNTVFSKTERIPVINYADIFTKTYPVGRIFFDSVCVTVEKDSTVFDKECFDAPMKEIQAEYDSLYPTPVSVEWKYYPENDALEIMLAKDVINSKIRLFSTDQMYIEEMVNETGFYTKTITAPKENMTLAVDDIDAKQQQVFQINLGPAGDEFGNTIVETGVKPISECKGQICSTGLVCKSQPIASIEGECCMTQCISAGEVTPEEGKEIIPLIVLIAIILAIIALFVLYKAAKVARK